MRLQFHSNICNKHYLIKIIVISIQKNTVVSFQKIQCTMLNLDWFLLCVGGKLWAQKKKNETCQELIKPFPYLLLFALRASKIYCNQCINGKYRNERVANQVCPEKTNKCHFVPWYLNISQNFKNAEVNLMSLADIVSY